MKKQFFKNVLPSMLAFAFTGIYAIVDGWFIGRNVGDTGLAAINIAFPIVALIQAVGTGIGMGGSIQIAICLGMGTGAHTENEKNQRKFLGNTLTLLLAACIVTTGILYFCAAPLLRLFGAEGPLLVLAETYIRIIILGGSFQILATGLIPLIRNYNGAIVAMAAMIAGFSCNVVLDWLFVSVLQYAVAGAAAATVIGQAVTIIPCIVFLWKNGKLGRYPLYKPAGVIVKRILSVGVSPFGLTLSPNLVIILLNKGAFLYGGDSAVACYAVVSYVVCIAQLLFQGVGDGCQPLISRYYGAKNTAAVRAILKMAYLFTAGIALVSMVGIFALRGDIAQFFGVSPEVGEMVAETLPVFISTFLCAGFLRVTTSYFYAIRKNLFAYVLIYGEPLLLAALIFGAFPLWMKLSGVWISEPVAQVLLTAAGIFLLWKTAVTKTPGPRFQPEEKKSADFTV